VFVQHRVARVDLPQPGLAEPPVDRIQILGHQFLLGVGDPTPMRLPGMGKRLIVNLATGWPARVATRRTGAQTPNPT
jgi:hypothetical protein